MGMSGRARRRRSGGRNGRCVAGAGAGREVRQRRCAAGSCNGWPGPQSKKRLREENQSDEEDAGSFRANLDDPRFARLFGDHDYALDPTDPRFKQSLGAKALAEEVSTLRLSLTNGRGALSGKHADGIATRRPPGAGASSSTVRRLPSRPSRSTPRVPWRN